LVINVDRTNDKQVQNNALTIRGSVLFGNKLIPVPVQDYNRISRNNIEEDTNVTLKAMKTNDKILMLTMMSLNLVMRTRLKTLTRYHYFSNIFFWNI